MITMEIVLARLPGLEPRRLEGWIAEGWVRPARGEAGTLFDELDLARCRLILELQDEMEVGEAALPVVLGLLDQLHRTRRQLRVVAEALEQVRRP